MVIPKGSLGLMVGLSIASAASAGIVGDLNDNTGYTVSNTDLLQTNLASVLAAGNFNKENINGMGPGTLNNGSFENLGGQQGATAGSGDEITYTLDTGVAPLGYNITEVDSYAGWSYGRYGQGYNLFVHLINTPANAFVQLDTVYYGPNGSSGATGPFPNDPMGDYSTSVKITPDLPTTVLATGVDEVRFAFTSSPNYVGDYNGYRELDVFGSAVPEPASMGLLLVAAGSALVRRRRV